MKLKFWQGEFEFDKDDAKIVIPLILLLLGLTVTPLPKVWLLVGFAAYYLAYFFLQKITEPLKKWFERLHNRRAYMCPYCASRYTVMLGWQEYLGDVPYHWYRCNDCGEESVFVDDKLVEPGPRRKNLTNGK
jgi:DNA-directed RNA polymerase subunit RPC12/RpoP